jgi:hypothetical protein
MNTDMQQLTSVNSIVMARLITGKPKLSTPLEKTHKQIVWAKGANEESVRAPSAKLFRTKDNAIAEINNLINGMAVYLKKKGMAVPNFDGTTYQQATNADEIQTEFDKRRDQIDGLLKQVYDHYDSFVAEGRKNVSGFHDEVEWPTADEFVSGYKFDLKWLGQPQSIDNSVLSAVSNETAARVRASSQQAVSQMLLEAHGETIEEAITEMGKTIEILTSGKRLHSSRFTHLESCINNLKQKNWLKLPEFDSIIDALKPCIVDPDALPDNSQRIDHAEKIKAAKATAEKTLTALGL